MTFIVVGIGGVTAGGKTTLCRSLVECLPSVISLHMDNYYRTDYSEQLEYLEEYDKAFANWDSVNAVDFERLVDDLETCITDLNKSKTCSEIVVYILFDVNFSLIFLFYFFHKSILS